MAFAVAQLAFGYLNSSTAFLGSIIIGNGINYAIVLMSRYEEHRSRGSDPDEALRCALGGTWRGTLVASIAASAAYASLTVTSFRGFSQFGVMGATGAIFCWLATYSVLPAHADDPRSPRADQGQRPASARAAGVRPPGAVPAAARGPRVGKFRRAVRRRRRRLRHFLKDPFEYDFRKLNAPLETSQQTQQFNRNLNDLFGRWPSPTILLADSVEEVEPMRTAIRRQDREAPGKNKAVIGQIVTIYDLLPGAPEVQKRKLDLLAQIRKLTHDPALDVLDEKEKADLAKIDPSPDLHELAPMDLPAIARRPFTEVDGAVGKVVLVYPPDQGLSVWNGRDLLLIASVLQNIKLDNGKVIETSGFAVVFGAMIRSILRDGPIATSRR